MGRIVRDLGEGITKHYWYPGEKGDWVKTVIALGAGGAAFLLSYVLFKSSLFSVTVGASVTTAIGGMHLGRRDVGGLRNFRDMGAQRRAAIGDSGRAAWRGTVQGFTCAVAAVLVVNMPDEGFVANWLLPLIPSVVGALAHTAGMIYERMSDFSVEALSEPTLTKRTAAIEDGADVIDPLQAFAMTKDSDAAV